MVTKEWPGLCCHAWRQKEWLIGVLAWSWFVVRVRRIEQIRNVSTPSVFVQVDLFYCTALSFFF